jgi:predicted TIM-barrel fold metal-dependent hydrolase
MNHVRSRALPILVASCTVLGSTIPALEQAAPFVLDGHVHLTNTSMLQYLWANASAGACPCAPPCLCNWTIPDYWVASTSLPTDKLVFVEVDVNHTQWLQEATWVQSLSDAGGEQGRMIGAIVAQPPPGFGQIGANATQLALDLDSLAKLPLVHGVRVSGINFSDPVQMETVVNHTRLLASHSLSMDIIVAVGSGNYAPGIVNLSNAVPEATFIINHLGSPPYLGTVAEITAWQQALMLLGGQTNIYCKVGGVLQGYKSTGIMPSMATIQPFVTTAFTAFGFTRALYEGNWFFVNWYQPPLLNVYTTWATYIQGILNEMGASDEDRDHYFRMAGITAYRVLP